VIHCDLWHDNIKVYRGELCPFDFEDTIWGFRLHDIAMAMLDLIEEVGEDRYAQLFPAFRAGYERHLDWPEGDMTLMQIGRMLWKTNYVARYEPQRFAQGMAFYIALFERYLAHGRLVSPLKPGSG
jgi:Ser/Thr protein kinase RdoA (MazF antagonist)